MIKSMTAFANKEINNGDVQLSWEVRSVNHRYLDANIYLPDTFSSQDAALKELLRKKLSRGKVDAKLTCNILDDTQNSKININHTIVNSILNAQNDLEAIAKEVSEEPLVPLTMSEILSFPGVQEKTEVDVSQYEKAVSILFKDVLNAFIESREEEGARLQDMLTTRAKNITEIVETVKKRRPIVVSTMREKILKKINDLDVKTDNNRLEQELAIQAQRLDVDEELDRLDSHIEELYAVLERDEPVGRRLDFLMQELNREANTLGSKANDAETTKASVELKVLIEQMREQVMNIE